MKRVLFLILALVMSGIFYVQPVSAGPSVDQEYYNATDGSLAIKSNVVILQSFRPMTYSTMHKIDVNLRNASGTVGFVLKKWNGEDWDPIRYINGQPAVNGWNTFDFEDVAVVVGARYCITLEASSYDTQWYYGQLAPNGPYPNGFAQYGGNYTDYPERDFHFRTWGTDPVEIVEEQTNPGSDQDPEQTGIYPASTTTGEVPATTVSTSIAKPSGLTATYSDGVALTWKASTTADVDGYIVFRSETKGKGYTKLTNVAKTKLDYTDKTAAASKTYYYVVRATKGVEQSASSNEATITIPATAAPVTPLNLKVKGTGSNYLGVEWDKNPEVNISGYELTISKGTENVETAQTDATATSYVFKNLEPVTEYTITLIAKNSDGKQSEAATLTVSTIAELAAITPAGFQMDTLSWIMLAAAVVLLGVLAFMVAKRRKNKKDIRT